MLSTGKAADVLVICEISANRAPADPDIFFPKRRAAIYLGQSCMSSAPGRHTTGIQLSPTIRLDIPASRLYRALSVSFVMVALL